jgi:oxalate decarboxylase
VRRLRALAGENDPHKQGEGHVFETLCSRHSSRRRGDVHCGSGRGIAAVVQTIRPGAMRQMHWHPNADEWQYYIEGKARMGVFNTGPNVVTMDFNPGDIGYGPRNYGHYVQNVGDTDMQFFAVFKTSRFEEFSLSEWLRHSPAEMVAEHLNVDPALVSKWPGLRAGVMPE